MNRTLKVTGLFLLFATGCGTDINQALLLAGESGARTFLDVLISDFFSDLPELVSFPPGPGEPNGGDSGDDAGTDAGDGAPTDGAGGDSPAEAGAAIYTANSCFACHCDDASGGCLPSAPDIVGRDSATLQEQLQGETPHTGGKFPDLTDQDIADLEAFLADDAGTDAGDGIPTDGAGGDGPAGAALYTANSCFACHCDDASGGCLPGAPGILGGDSAMLQEWLQGGTPHTGGKFPDLTDQDIADLEAFLADL